MTNCVTRAGRRPDLNNRRLTKISKKALSACDYTRSREGTLAVFLPSPTSHGNFCDGHARADRFVINHVICCNCPSKTCFTRQNRATGGVIWGDHRIIMGKAPPFPILVYSHAIGCTQMPFKHLQLLAVFQTDEVIRKDRFSNRDSRNRRGCFVYRSPACLLKGSVH